MGTNLSLKNADGRNSAAVEAVRVVGGVLLRELAD